MTSQFSAQIRATHLCFWTVMATIARHMKIWRLICSVRSPVNFRQAHVSMILHYLKIGRTSLQLWFLIRKNLPQKSSKLILRLMITRIQIVYIVPLIVPLLLCTCNRIYLVMKYPTRLKIYHPFTLGTSLFTLNHIHIHLTNLPLLNNKHQK